MLSDSHTLARGVAERYRALCARAVAPLDAERHAFAELLGLPDGAAPEADLSGLYADFLRLARPEAVRAHGIYATPSAIVQAQVRLVDDLLRRRLHCPDGFGDPRVHVIDPAVGVGTYPLAILQHIGSEAAAIVQAALQRMVLLETMPGAAAIGRARGLPIRECDALQTELATDAGVVVVIGNPPYRRRPGDAAARASLDGFITSSGGVHRKNLYNDYVYFWRWALRVAVENRSGPGVICFVTAGSYVQGPAFSGMRQTLRQLVDELWLLDLEGDHRAARASDNVFPIRTPVAIALAVRYGAHRDGAPRLHYARLDGSAERKINTLNALRTLKDVEWLPAPSVGSEPMRPAPHTRYLRWPALTELFPWQTSGAQLKRTWPIGISPDVLRTRWQRLLALPVKERASAFGPSRDRSVQSAPPDLLEPGRRLRPVSELPRDAACVAPVRYGYRAFDRQWVLPDARLGDFLRPALWKVNGPRQVFLTTMLTNVLGPGPAAVATALVPDLDHFRGSFGARGVIPLWLDAQATQANVSTVWLDRLREHHGSEITAPALMACCYALLSAPSYMRRLEAELRTPGPHVPIPTDAATFIRGAALGAALIMRHTYRLIEPGVATVIGEIGEMWPTGYSFDGQTLVVGDGCIRPVAQEAWNYRVSGYPVLNGWLRQRLRPRPRVRGRSPLDAMRPPTWTPELTRELLELIWLLEATLAAQPALDALLDEAISGSDF